MSFLILTVLLTVVQAIPPVPRQTPDNAAGGSQNIQQNAKHNQNPAKLPTTISPKDQAKQDQSPCQEPQKADAKKTVIVTKTITVSKGINSWWDRSSVIFTGLLVLIGAIGIYWAVKTVQATETAANAALLNAQAAIAATRPWISFFATHTKGAYTFKAANMGGTPARVISFASGMEFVDRVESLPIPPVYTEDQFPTLPLLTPDHYADGANIIIGTYDTNTIFPTDHRKQIVTLFFRVIYENPLIGTKGNPRHESRMCFWYKHGAGHTPQPGGPREYNEHS